MMQAFSNISADMLLSPEQAERVNQDVQDSGRCCFMMSDAGGPELSQWHTTFEPSTGLLVIDKRWIMVTPGAHNFGIVAARRQGQFHPLMVLVDVERATMLQFAPAGPPFLHDSLHLSNVRGQVTIRAEDILNRVGPLAVSLLLALIRPQFVRCLMIHLLWLKECARLVINDVAEEGIRWLHGAALAVASEQLPTSTTLRQVLALKFASNEILLELVIRGAFVNAADERDALAFTKMEGSSYRCFKELCAKAEVHQR
jgi:hypothetical protein